MQEFSGDDDVTLLISSRFNNDSNQDKVIGNEVKKFIKQYGDNNPAHIARCTKVVPEFMMPSLYRSCDAFVLFSRGEGSGFLIVNLLYAGCLLLEPIVADRQCS